MKVKLTRDEMEVFGRAVPSIPNHPEMQDAIAAVESIVAERVEPLEFQIAEVRRVIQALKEAEGSFHGPVVDEVRRSAGNWLEAALEGRLHPTDVRQGYSVKPEES